MAPQAVIVAAAQLPRPSPASAPQLTAVGVQQHLEHRPGPQRGANDVCHSLRRFGQQYYELCERRVRSAPAAAPSMRGAPTFAAAMLPCCALRPCSRLVEAFSTVTGTCILPACLSRPAGQGEGGWLPPPSWRAQGVDHRFWSLPPRVLTASSGGVRATVMRTSGSSGRAQPGAAHAVAQPLSRARARQGPSCGWRWLPAVPGDAVLSERGIVNLTIMSGSAWCLGRRCATLPGGTPPAAAAPGRQRLADPAPALQLEMRACSQGCLQLAGMMMHALRGEISAGGWAAAGPRDVLPHDAVLGHWLRPLCAANKPRLLGHALRSEHESPRVRKMRVQVRPRPTPPWEVKEACHCMHPRHAGLLLLLLRERQHAMR